MPISYVLSLPLHGSPHCLCHIPVTSAQAGIRDSCCTDCFLALVEIPGQSTCCSTFFHPVTQ